VDAGRVSRGNSRLQCRPGAILAHACMLIYIYIYISVTTGSNSAVVCGIMWQCAEGLFGFKFAERGAGAAANVLTVWVGRCLCFRFSKHTSASGGSVTH
jgi:hypothetical protein